MPGLTVCSVSLTYLLELVVEEQRLSLKDQGEVGVVSDIDGRVMCCVRDSKEYQALLTGPCGSKSKAKKKGKGKETMPPLSNLADSDNLPNPPDDADIVPVDHHAPQGSVSILFL